MIFRAGTWNPQSRRAHPARGDRMVNCFLECRQRIGGNSKSFLLRSILACACLVVLLCFCKSESAHTLPLHEVRAIPAFARKYGLPCSSCHEAWPKLSPFGQSFTDNGYQMGNEREAAIYQQRAYCPIALRITPNLHRESSNHQGLDDPANPGGTIEQKVTTHGFDL